MNEIKMAAICFEFSRAITVEIIKTGFSTTYSGCLYKCEIWWFDVRV